jgi:hypothetical protein
MADGVSGIGSAPFNIGSHIHEQTRARQAIENHFAEQRVEKEHRATHRHLEALEKKGAGSGESYDQFGRKTNADRPQGTKINIEV